MQINTESSRTTMLGQKSLLEKILQLVVNQFKDDTSFEGLRDLQRILSKLESKSPTDSLEKDEKHLIRVSSLNQARQIE